MLLPLKMICSEKRTRRDGNADIFIQYCWTSTKRTLLNTGIEIPPRYWDDSKQMIKATLPDEFGDVEVLNDSIKRMFRCVEDIVEFATKRKIEEPILFVRKIFNPGINQATLPDLLKRHLEGDERSNLDFFFQYDKYVESKIKLVSPKMCDIYRNARARLKSFEEFRKKPITFDSLDYSFYEEFSKYLMYEYVQRRYKGRRGLKLNTVGSNIKQLRVFLRNRAMKKIIEPINLQGWTIFEEAADAVYVSWPEITKIYNVDLSAQPFLEEYRDDFVLGCLTGLRFSDFSKLHATDLRGEFLYKKQQKSNHWVVVPLRHEAKLILEKRFKNRVKPQSNPEFNRHIKTIAKLAGINELVTHSHKEGNKDIAETKPKYEWITSHTCRRSFCTNEFLAETPVELIMKISGHKTTKDFYKYIKVAPEEAANRIKTIWERRAGTTQEFGMQSKLILDPHAVSTAIQTLSLDFEKR